MILIIFLESISFLFYKYGDRREFYREIIWYCFFLYNVFLFKSLFRVRNNVSIK